MILDIVNYLQIEIEGNTYVNIDQISFEITELLRGKRNKNYDWINTIFDAFDVKGDGLME